MIFTSPATPENKSAAMACGLATGCSDASVACNGSRATIAAVAADGGTDLTELWSVGRLISISVGKNRVVALAYSMQTEGKDWGEGADNQFLIEVELLGEVYVQDDGKEVFSRPVSRAIPISAPSRTASAPPTFCASMIRV